MVAIDRYSRQTLFGPIGKEGQERLHASRVTIIGCGALGTVLANNLCRAGIGSLVIADRDYIELNNLQRQILFDEDDITRRLPKAIAAAEKLRRINSDVSVKALVEDINADGIESLVRDVDLVLDATDNFETRYLLNDVCIKYNRPWIYRRIQVSVLNCRASMTARRAGSINMSFSTRSAQPAAQASVGATRFRSVQEYAGHLLICP